MSPLPTPRATLALHPARRSPAFAHAPRRAMIRPAVLVVAAIALVALTAACSSGPESPVTVSQPLAASAASDAHAQHGRDDDRQLTPGQRQAVAQVRRATSRFHDLATAQAAGYTNQYPAGCAQSPDGAQGFHYLNPALVDATVDLLRPELVMYEPGPDGTLHLVGVDYVVPLTASATPPTLLGVPFMRNEPLGVWALHIWAWRPNPSGMFAAWNPKVSCAYAP